MCNSAWLQDTSVIIFFINQDLLLSKVGTSPISRPYPDFVGDPSDGELVVKYLVSRFNLSQSQPEGTTRVRPNSSFKVNN